MNSKWHLISSILKSILRIAGCIYVILNPTFNGVKVLAVLFALAEILGILEELGDKR